MSRTDSRTVSEELRFLLHPADRRDIAVPGFPTHDALVAWARSQPADQLVEAAVQVLRDDGWPQQYAAMALLRAMGADVEGDGFEDKFRWQLKLPGGRPRFVEPSVKESSRWPENPQAAPDRGELDEIRTAVATAINQLDERKRIIVALHYYEKLSFGDIAGVLGVNEAAVLIGHRGALQQIPGLLTPPQS